MERQLTQRRIGALPADARKELMSRKREVQLERMLLPDAPPRKRQTKKKSPERQPCIMVNPNLTRKKNHRPQQQLACPVLSNPTRKKNHRPQQQQLACRVLSNPTRKKNHRPQQQLACPVLSNPTSKNVGAEVVIRFSDSSPAVGVTGKHYESVMEEWLQLADDIIGDSDDDDDFNIEDINERSVVEHSATAEPACPTDLTAFQAEVLQAEDEANDRVLRDFAPDDAYNWSKDRSTFLGRRSVFTGTSGPTFEITTNSTHRYRKYNLT